jgi:hypothetical protein
MAFWNPKNPPAALLFQYQPPSAVPIEFHNYKDSVMRAAGILWVSTMHSRSILHETKRDHLDRVHSDQMVLEKIRQGRLVR